MPKIGAQFDLRSPKPNFHRDQFETTAAMKACTLNDVDRGHIAFCIETGIHYVFNTNGEYNQLTGYWTEMSASTIISSSTPPSDTRKIWVDTSGDPDDPYIEIDQLKSEVVRLRVQVDQLLKLLVIGVKGGDSTIGGRTMLANLAKPIIPWSDITESDCYTPGKSYVKDELTVYNKVIYYAIEDISEAPETFDSSQWTTDCPDKLEPWSDSLVATVPNIAIKMDTSANFKKRYNNLIDGELIFCTDLNTLYIYKGGRFIEISGSSSKKTVEIDINSDGVITIADPSGSNVWIENNKLHFQDITEINDDNLLIITI